MARVGVRWRAHAALVLAAALACAACGPVNRAPEGAPAAAPTARRAPASAERKGGAAVPEVAPEAPAPAARIVLANELTNVRAVLFSPDGALLAVDDEERNAAGCFGYTVAVIHVYDTATWRERLIVWAGEALVAWAFAPAGDVLLVATRSNIALGEVKPLSVSAIDMRSGDVTDTGSAPTETPFPARSDTDVHAARGLRAAGSDQEVRVVASATGKEVARLGLPRRARTFAEVRDDGQKVLFRALWPGGKRAAWDVMTGESAPFPPGWKPPRPSSELGGDPNAPIALDGPRPMPRTVAFCEGAECQVDTGSLGARVIAGDEPLTAAVWDGARYDLLGGDAEALFRCVSGRRVVEFSECAGVMPVSGLAGEIRRQALADAEAARRSTPE